MTEIKFVMKTSPVVLAWPLKLSVPLDGGLVQEQTVTAKIELIGGDEIDAIAKDVPYVEFTKKFYDRAVKGFVDFTDDKGTQVPDDVALKFFRQLHYARVAVMAAHAEMSNGRASELAKNSERPSQPS